MAKETITYQFMGADIPVEVETIVLEGVKFAYCHKCAVLVPVSRYDEHFQASHAFPGF